jgi:hypothetical protein
MRGHRVVQGGPPASGEASPESLLEVQELYDNHFMKSAAWEGRR